MVLHLNGLGRIDLSGMLTMRAVLDDLDLPVIVADVPAHGRRLVSRVLPADILDSDGHNGTIGPTGGRPSDSSTTSDGEP
jgi:hypothetical protein